jgi:hypothetical protein
LEAFVEAARRDPAAATRRYLATTTPQGAIVDLGGFALTFASHTTVQDLLAIGP